MECRDQCGACCIAPAISRPFFGMPGGKPAGERCIHLLPSLACAIFEDPRRPEVCRNFKPEPEFCGSNREQAIEILTLLEAQSAPETYS